MHVYYDMVNNGTITVENGGALIYNSCTKTASGTGTYTISRNSPDYIDKYFYSYWSSPLQETDSDPAVLFPNNQTIYFFNSDQASADWEFHDESNFKPGVGYAIRHDNTGSYTATFTGTPNYEDISVQLYNNSNADGSDGVSSGGDNLIGNPYTSAIDWDLVITDPENTDVDGTIYVWNQNEAHVGENSVDDYLEYNITGGASNTTTGILGTGQGFFIRVSAATTLTFKPTHQIIANNTQFYRNENNDAIPPKKQGRSWFVFRKENTVSPILIGFLDGARKRFDRLYDTQYNALENDNAFGFYSLVKRDVNQKTSIQGLPKLNRDKKVVKLGFEVSETGEYTIEMVEEYIDSAYYIYLRDKEMKVTTDLRQLAYTFTVDSIGEHNDRFKLIYTKKKRKATQERSAVVDMAEIDFDNFAVYVDDTKELVVEYDHDEDNIKEVSIYDIQGREVAAFSGLEPKNISHLKRGIYVVHALLFNNSRITKKILITN